LNKRLFASVSAGALLFAGAVFAQGLPFSSDASTDRPWTINQLPPRDLSIFHVRADPTRTDQSAAAQDHVTAPK
jgi:hypothetical protein